MAAKMAAILGEVTGPQQRWKPQYIAYFVEHITGFLVKVKSSRNIAT